MTNLYVPKYGTHLEHAIVRALVGELDKAGFKPFEVDWGDAKAATLDLQSVLDEVFSVDDCTVRFLPTANPAASRWLSVRLICGNGHDMLQSWSTADLGFREAVERVSDAIGKIGPGRRRGTAPITIHVSTGLDDATPVYPHRLTEDQESTITNALRCAAKRFTESAADFRGTEWADMPLAQRTRMAEQFERQATEATELAMHIDANGIYPDAE